MWATDTAGRGDVHFCIFLCDTFSAVNKQGWQVFLRPHKLQCIARMGETCWSQLQAHPCGDTSLEHRIQFLVVCQGQAALLSTGLVYGNQKVMFPSAWSVPQEVWWGFPGFLRL